jgi:hypothetical protein
MVAIVSMVEPLYATGEMTEHVDFAKNQGLVRR